MMQLSEYIEQPRLRAKQFRRDSNDVDWKHFTIRHEAINKWVQTFQQKFSLCGNILTSHSIPISQPIYKEWSSTSWDILINGSDDAAMVFHHLCWRLLQSDITLFIGLSLYSSSTKLPCFQIGLYSQSKVMKNCKIATFLQPIVQIYYSQPPIRHWYIVGTSKNRIIKIIWDTL